NPNYKTQPQNMLLARATAECARLIAADVLMGMPYSAEELADAQPVREHVSALVAAGYTITSIAAASDTDAATLQRVLYGP
ncbi:hypothetical protein KBZ21_41525, partial [Streptomyces sp. A73]|nr:hypothetical protein [Streptomyces sp. A73]